MLVRWMSDPSHLSFSSLVVTGKIHYTTEADLRQAILGSGHLGTFMSQDINSIQQNVKSIPWIKQVSVRKQWPDRLRLHLVEYVPAARWNDLNFVDEKGNVFGGPVDLVGKDITSFPMLFGPEESERDVLIAYHEMAPLIDAVGLKLKKVSMKERRSWQLVVEQPETGHETLLELGRNDRMVRLRRFITLWSVLDQQVKRDNKEIHYVDLRYDAGAAVGWQHPQLQDNDSNEQSG